MEERALLETTNAPWHLVNLSWRKGLPREQQKFAADSSLGTGVTIFVMDTGVNITGPRTQVSLNSLSPFPHFLYHNAECDRLTNFFDTSTEHAEEPRDVCRSEPIDIGRNRSKQVGSRRHDRLGHPWNTHSEHSARAIIAIHCCNTNFSKQACNAGGTTLSQAGKANLYLMKIVNSYVYKTDPLTGQPYVQLDEGPMKPDAWLNAFFNIANTVQSRNLQGKSVVQHAWGKSISKLLTVLSYVHVLFPKWLLTTLDSYGLWPLDQRHQHQAAIPQ